ncbi:hypothetical protein [Ureibacillus sp. FSL W8-0352]
MLARKRLKKLNRAYISLAFGSSKKQKLKRVDGLFHYYIFSYV